MIKKKRIYRNKNYWKGEAMKQSIKSPSERFKELIDDECYSEIKREIPILQSMLNKQLK